jgi:hypothetical protein
MLTYNKQPELIVLDGEVLEVYFPTQEELAAKTLNEKYGGSIQETQYGIAQEQRAERIESQYFTERG